MLLTFNSFSSQGSGGLPEGQVCFAVSTQEAKEAEISAHDRFGDASGRRDHDVDREESNGDRDDKAADRQETDTSSKDSSGKYAVQKSATVPEKGQRLRVSGEQFLSMPQGSEALTVERSQYLFRI